MPENTEKKTPEVPLYCPHCNGALIKDDQGLLSCLECGFVTKAEPPSK